MTKTKMTNVKIILAERMKNKKFSEEYENLSEEFELAKEVIKLRTDAKLTQKELAKLAGTSQPAIARLESGSYHNVTLSFLRKIGSALGAHPEVHFHKA